MPPATARSALVIFARLDEGGAKTLGLGAARDRALGACLLRRVLATAKRASGGRPILLYTDHPVPAELARGTVDRLQRGDGFESRLLGALEDARRLGFERLVVVGSDTPGLRPSDLRRALASRAGTVAIGPSEDGGFYLLALDAGRLDLLRGLPWCGRRVAAALVARARAGGTPLVTGRRRRDVDGPRDVGRLRPLLQRVSRLHLDTPLWSAPPAPSRSERAPTPGRGPLRGPFAPRPPPPAASL